jgi:hypothetical protein
VIKALMVVLAAALASAAIFIAPPANATNPIGNFDLVIPDRFDFHTWVWSVTPCVSGKPPPECIHVFGIARPVAKAFNYEGDALVVDGHYTLTVDDPFGLRCGNVYYGPTSTTHDVYTWDATTMAGTLTSSFDAGCDGAPGTAAYPISLLRL